MAENCRASSLESLYLAESFYGNYAELNSKERA